MKNNVVQTLWIDANMGAHQRECLKSFLRLGSEVHCYSYNAIENIPEGVIVKDANEIIEEHNVFKDLYHSYATFSDWFRIKLLYDRGGWWIDSDVLCLKPFDIEWPYVFATEIEYVDGKEFIHICNCVIKMPRGSEMGKSLLERIEEKLYSIHPSRIKWTEIGAQYMAKEIILRDLFEYVVDHRVFCPFDYSNFQQVFTDSEFEPNDLTYGIHLWNKMWEWKGKDPMEQMKVHSFFDRFIIK